MEGNKASISVGLVGCGAASEVLYAPALRLMEMEGVAVVVTLVDPSQERRRTLGALFPSARQCQTLDEALSSEAPSVAIVSAPHRHHAELSIACLQRSIHVLCEKPMAATVAECDAMIAAAEKSGRLLAVGHFRRFFPSSQVMKRVLSSGMLGSVGSFRFLEGRSFNWPAQSASFFRRSEASGGVLIDTGAHTIDLLMWWLGGVGEVVEYADDAMGGVEANCSLRLAMGNGAEGYVQLSRDWPLPNRCVIECERGWIAYSCDVINRIEWGLFDVDYGLDTEIRAMAATRLTDGRSLAGPVPGMAECFAAQLRNVLAAISGCEPLAVSGTEARKTIVLVQKCYQNRRLLRMPWLADDERRRAEELSRA